MEASASETLYRIDFTWACFGITVDSTSKVIEAAPIGAWMVGRQLPAVRRWVELRHGTIESVSVE